MTEEYPRQVTVYVWGSGKPVTFCLYRWYLPIGNKKFPDGKILFCRLSGKNFAVGKCLAGHRQNSLGVNGKIPVFPSAKFYFINGKSANFVYH
ncbi:MAG TPA: hypothetical protein IAA30_07300 [Candidatus Treponema faecavium]|nr:hypothetical protein [Candidatus Treponema faecavium]